MAQRVVRNARGTRQRRACSPSPVERACERQPPPAAAWSDPSPIRVIAGRGRGLLAAMTPSGLVLRAGTVVVHVHLTAGAIPR